MAWSNKIDQAAVCLARFLSAFKRKFEIWQALRAKVVDAAQKLESAGVDILLICTNTMHRMAPEVQAAVNIPLLHIAAPQQNAQKMRAFKKLAYLAPLSQWIRSFIKAV